MALGSAPLGAVPLGVDAVRARSAAARRAKTPASIEFNPSTGHYVMGSNGGLAEVHPVDQRVALALGVIAQSYKSAPTTGHDLLNEPNPGDPSFKTRAANRIRYALRIPLARGDIQIHAITTNVVDGPQEPRGRTEHIVDYTNLRTKKRQTLKA